MNHETQMDMLGGFQSDSYAASKTPFKSYIPDYDIPAEVDKDLVNILSWPRPHGSLAEIRFCSWLNGRLREITGSAPQILEEGCLYVVVAGETGPSTTLFSCHVDTVDDPASGTITEDVPRKSLVYDASFGLITLDKDNKVGSCLGADDGAGIWLMLKMLAAKVPGGYIFHRGEERGGIGSRAILAKNKALLEKYELAVAFDRADEDEIITHQGGQECASDKLALALGAAMKALGLPYAPSRNGSFTDTKVYRGVISECINMGVGYKYQHGKTEQQNYGHLAAMAEAVCKLDWNSLPIDRDHRKADPVHQGSRMGNSSWYNNFGFGDPVGSSTSYGKKKKKQQKQQAAALLEHNSSYVFDSAYDSILGTSFEDIQLWVENSPDSAATTIVELMLEIGRLRSDANTYKQLAGVETGV